MVDVERECASILAVVERSFRSLRAIIESRRVSSPRALLHAICLGTLRNYKLLVRLLRMCGYRGPVRGGRASGWLPLVAAYEAVFRRGSVTLERVENFLGGVARCLWRVEPSDAVRGVKDEVERLSILYSVPHWVVEKLAAIHDFGRVESILAAFNRGTPMYVRFNRMLLDAGRAVEVAREAGVYAEPDPVLDDVLVVERVEPGAVARLDPRLFYIQDRSAALAAHILGDVKGVVLDSFSAPGGKAGHVLWRNPGAVVVAVELSPRRLRDERRLLSRQGVLARVVLLEADARRPPVAKARAALVDPDCSSIGRIGHSPETRLFLEQAGPRIVGRLSRLQYEGLRAALERVEKGGIVVYTTCTLTREENEDVIRRVVDEGLAELDEASPWIGERSPLEPRAQRIYPDTARCGGGFAARLIRV